MFSENAAQVLDESSDGIPSICEHVYFQKKFCSSLIVKNTPPTLDGLSFNTFSLLDSVNFETIL